MLESVAVFVAGGLFGVFCDRLWRKVEDRVRLRIIGKWQLSVEGQGILLRLKNEGNKPLPPLHLCLFSPNMGTYYIFPPAVRPGAPNSESNEVWPGQEREFVCPVSQTDDTMLKSVAEEATNPHIVFRVEPIGGGGRLFQSHRIGEGLARILGVMLKVRHFRNLVANTGRTFPISELGRSAGFATDGTGVRFGNSPPVRKTPMNRHPAHLRKMPRQTKGQHPNIKSVYTL